MQAVGFCASLALQPSTHSLRASSSACFWGLQMGMKRRSPREVLLCPSAALAQRSLHAHAVMCGRVSEQEQDTVCEELVAKCSAEHVDFTMRSRPLGKRRECTASPSIQVHYCGYRSHWDEGHANSRSAGRLFQTTLVQIRFRNPQNSTGYWGRVLPRLCRFLTASVSVCRSRAEMSLTTGRDG